jgi:hypothetical protein
MIKFGMALMEMVEQLTKGYIKATGKQPGNLEKLKIQEEAIKRFKDMNKVVDMKGNPINPAEGILGGQQAQNFSKKLDPALYEDRGGNIIPAQFDESPAFPSYTAKETEEQIRQRLLKNNKDGIASMKSKLDDPEKKADGGRAGFVGGGMGRRGFLKLLGGVGAGIGALKSGILGFGGKKAGTEVAKKVAKEAATSGAPPPHFLKLVAKIKALGNDATPKYGSQPREKVTAYKDYQLTEQLDSGQTTIQRFKQSEIDYYDEMLMEETYMSHTPGKNLADETTGGKNIPDEYTEDTSYMRASGSQEGDIMETVSGVSDDIFEEVGEVVPEAIRKEKADGGRIGYAGGKKVFDVTAKKIKNKLGKNADKTEIPKETLLRDMFNKSNTRLNDKKMMNADELEDFEMEIGDALEGYDFDGTIGDANRILREQKRYTSEMLGEYMSIGGSKRPGGPNDAMADAIENASPGYTGDLKYDANILADDLAENRFGKEFDRLSQKQQMDLYDEAYKALAENKRTFTEMQNLSRPKKTLEGIKKTGVIDISDPDIAEEFTKFMKEKNPKGFTDMEQKIQLESFDPKKTKGNAEGGRIV